MSVAAITWAWKQRVARNLLPELLALADNANDLGVCWVRVSTIADKTSTTERTVQRNLTSLHSAGLLNIIERRIKGSGNRCNLYLLPLPGVDAASQRDFISELTTGTLAVPRARGEGDTSDTQGVTHTTPRGDASDTHNHQKEPSLKGPQYQHREEAAPKPAKNAKPKGHHRLPDDWTVPEELKAKLAKQGYQAEQIEEQEDKFRTYWHERNDQAARKASWNLAFQNWIKRAGKEKAGPEGPANSQYKPNRGHYVRPNQPSTSGAGLIGQLANKRHKDPGRPPTDQGELIEG